MKSNKVTILSLRDMKQHGQKIVVLTCYDYPMARLLNDAGVDILLVGDSVGMVKLGLKSTLPVTVEDMLYHTRIVARGNSRALLVTDMPYLSYHVDPKEAVRAAGRFLKAGAEAVKLEGGREMLPVVNALRRAKIPVMGHLGMTPQSVHQLGGYKVQGRNAKAAKALLADAKALEKAGAFSLVLECMPVELARKISRALSIPTIGIGAGSACDGQVLVIDDLLGWTAPPLPRFVKGYAHFRQEARSAIGRYCREVRSGEFPDPDHSYF